MRWTDEEKDAAEDLRNLWGYEWKQHVEEYQALANRSQKAIAGYLKNNILAGQEMRIEPVERGAWPEQGVLINGRFIGVRLFEIDQDAVLNHGSPGKISRAVDYSASGCSARWASEAA